MKILFLDLETSGLDPAKHGITQIAARIEIDGAHQESLDLKPRLFPGDLMSKEALERTGVTVDELKSRDMSPQSAYVCLTETLGRHCDKFDRGDKFFLVAYNGHFDDGFLRRFFEKNHDDYYGSWFWWPPLDLAVMVAWVYSWRRAGFRDFKLATVCAALGITAEGKDHEAVHDLDLLCGLHQRLQADLPARVVEEGQTA